MKFNVNTQVALAGLCFQRGHKVVLSAEGRKKFLKHYQEYDLNPNGYVTALSKKRPNQMRVKMFNNKKAYYYPQSYFLHSCKFEGEIILQTLSL